MTRAFVPIVVALFACFVSIDTLYGQDDQTDETTTTQTSSSWPTFQNKPTDDVHLIERGPGWYFSLWKLPLCILSFLIWVRLADFVNRDSQEVGEETGMPPEVWNPIMVFSFLGGFLFAISFPFFLLGFPLYLAAAIAPFVTYVIQRNAKSDPAETIFTKAHRIRRKERKLVKRGGSAPTKVLEQDKGLPVEFSPITCPREIAQSNMIRARQFPAFLIAKELVYGAVMRRVDQILIDYTRDQTAFRNQIDGFWHALPPIDRPTGDELLVVLKLLAGLDPQDRRSRQTGRFGAKFPDNKLECDITTQGVKTGERVQIKIIIDKKTKLSLTELGMLPRMEEDLRQFLNNPGLVLASCKPGDGMTTSWNAVITSADRIMRDFVGIGPSGADDTRVENIEIHTFDKDNPSKAGEIFRQLSLKMPEAYIVSDPTSGAFLNQLTEEIIENERFALTRVYANGLPESIARVAALKPDLPEFAKALKAVLYWRLVRRLCDFCKQPYQPSPQLMQKLRLSPNQVPQLYREWQPPPPEQLVDAKGRPIEPQLCQVCGGLGYLGRIAIYELLVVNDEIRRAIVNQPSVEGITAAAKSSGHTGLQGAGLNLVVAGVTSLTELQRVLKS